MGVITAVTTSRPEKSSFKDRAPPFWMRPKAGKDLSRTNGLIITAAIGDKAAIDLLTKLAQAKNVSRSSLCRNIVYAELGLAEKPNPIRERAFMDHARTFGRKSEGDRNCISFKVSTEAAWRLYIRARYVGLSVSKLASNWIRQAYLGGGPMGSYRKTARTSRWTEAHNDILARVKARKDAWDTRPGWATDWKWKQEIDDRIEDQLCSGSVVHGRNLLCMKPPDAVETVDDDEIDRIDRKLRNAGVIDSDHFDDDDGIAPRFRPHWSEYDPESERAGQTNLFGEIIAPDMNERRAWVMAGKDPRAYDCRHDGTEEDDEDSAADRTFNGAIRSIHTGRFEPLPGYIHKKKRLRSSSGGASHFSKKPPL